MSECQKIGIAVVESAGHVLVGVRADDVELPGLHEFPGGKCHSDEMPKSCVVRECREETGLLVIPREHLLTTTFQYDHAAVELHFWRCSPGPGVPDCAAANAPFQWVATADLVTLNFPDANADVLQLLTQPART